MSKLSRFFSRVPGGVLAAAVVLTSLAAPSCQPAAVPRSEPVATTGVAAGEPSAAEDRAAIRKVLDDQTAAWNKGDLEAFMAGYWNSEQLSFYSGKTRTSGWKATLDRYRKRYQSEGKEMGQLRFTLFDIDLVGPDAALVRGRFHLKMKKEQPEGLFTLLFRRLPEGWRIVHDHTSS